MKGEYEMGLLSWLIVGLIAGWLANQMMRSGRGNAVTDIVVGTHADDIRFGQLCLHILLGHDKATQHPASLAHVKLVRPVCMLDKFILCQTELIHLLLQRSWDLMIMSQEVKKPLGVVDMIPPDLSSSSIAGIGIVPVAADIVG